MKATCTLASALLFTVAVISGCKKEETTDPPAPAEVTNAPVLPSRPYDYPKSSNDSLAELGRVLFYDKNLSLNNSVSCGSCHQQTRAFCDNKQFSTGLEDRKTSRNSPSIFAKNGSMFWDARAGSMEELVFMPVQNHVEMKFSDLRELTDKIRRIDYYKPMLRRVFQTENIDESNIRQAMVEFLANFDFSNNKFARSQGNIERLNAPEQRGMDIFFNKGRCASCHNIRGFNGGTGGGYGAVTPNHIFNIGLDDEYKDRGVGDRTGKADDYGKFLAPVLLNVEYTTPYMHDGRFQTLEQVVEHYNSGIKPHQNLSVQLRDFSSIGSSTFNGQIFGLVDKNKNGLLESEELRPFPPAKLGLTDAEKGDLVAFLKTLSDPAIFNDSRFKDPFTKQ